MDSSLVIVSGGQTGADLGGWKAAKRFALGTEGWMPAGYLTEDGVHPEYAELYGARPVNSVQYPDRTRRNVGRAHAVFLFCTRDGFWSPGSRLTRRVAVETGRCIRGIAIDVADPIFNAGHSAAWVRDGGFRRLLVAGNRESKAPGIGQFVEDYLCEVFRHLGLTEVSL